MKNRLAGFFLFLDQFRNRLRWLGAFFDPSVDFVLIELDAARFDSWIIGSNLFDVATVARKALVADDDTR